MSQLIRVGHRFINLDLMTEASSIAEDSSLFVYFGEEQSEFNEAEASALLAYLTDQATDVLAWHEKRQSAEHAAKEAVLQRAEQQAQNNALLANCSNPHGHAWWWNEGNVCYQCCSCQAKSDSPHLTDTMERYGGRDARMELLP